jgi:hypothetical protein
MSGVLDYFDIELEVKKVLDDALEETVVTVEQELNFPSEMTPWIGIYMDRRIPSANQFLRAGMRIDYDLQLSIWCYCYSMDMPHSVRSRNRLIMAAERALMANRTLNGLVETCFLNGGEMATARLQGDSVGFAAGGEIQLTAKGAVILEG